MVKDGQNAVDGSMTVRMTSCPVRPPVSGVDGAREATGPGFRPAVPTRRPADPLRAVRL